jgi:hypothetical protein
MDNIRPMDLGNGHRLLIQVNSDLNPNLNRYRAVVKDANGTIVARITQRPFYGVPVEFRERKHHARTQR